LVDVFSTDKVIKNKFKKSDFGIFSLQMYRYFKIFYIFVAGNNK